MKKYTTLYYLLFVLIVMGAFASMAQNDYGMTILGFAAASFSAIFLVQLISVIPKKDTKDELVEVACLFVLTAIMAMRVFYLRFEFVEYVFAIVGIALVLVYGRKMIVTYDKVKTYSGNLALLILIYYGSLMLYLISMITVPFLPTVSEPLGMLALTFMILSAVGNFALGDVLVNTEKTTGFQFALRLRDRSMVLLTLFLLFTCYMAFTKFNLVPRLYSDEFPQSYYQLVNQAEIGKEVQVEGKFKHEIFKERYENFLQHNPAAE